MPTGCPIDWPSVRDKLGRVPDETIAAELGCSTVAVAQARRALGRIRKRTGPAGILWDSVSELGKLPDAIVAHRIGVERSSVSAARIRRNLPPVPTRRAIVDMPTDVAKRIRAKYPESIPFNLAVLMELIGE